MKKTILMTSLFALSACGGGGPSAGYNNDQKIKELGTCSASFVYELNIAEMNLNMYKEYGLAYAKELITAHINFLGIQKKYGDVSCDAVDKSTGEIIKVTKSYINEFVNAVYSEIRAADSGKCRSSYSYLSPKEKAGCSQIKMYLNPNNG